VRTRANLYGRTGSGNRCGHRRKNFVRPDRKEELPRILLLASMRLRSLALPLLLGRYARRSELEEAVKAVGDVMICRTDLLTLRIGRPDRKRPRKFHGLSIDYDLAPLADISESRVERVLGTFEDWGWLHWVPVKPGRRKAKRGFLRCAAQPIDKTKTGERRGRAAIRCWTPEFFKALGLGVAMHDARQHRAAEISRAADVVRVPIRPLVASLAESLSVPDPDERPPP
jgi:hypothetical protein